MKAINLVDPRSTISPRLERFAIFIGNRNTKTYICTKSYIEFFFDTLKVFNESMRQFFNGNCTQTSIFNNQRIISKLSTHGVYFQLFYTL